MAITITCLNYFIEITTFRIVSTLIWGIFVCFFPHAIYFLPLIFYDIIKAKSILPYVPYFISIIRFGDIWTLADGISLLIGLTCAILLYRYTAIHDSLIEQFKKSRDDSIELNSLLQEKNHTLIQKQNAEIYAATLKERNRIAREIHDNVGHLLSRSILMSGALKATNKESMLTPNIQVLEDTLTAAMDTIRNSVHDLHNRSVDLYETLNSLIEEFHYCDISLDYDIQSEVPADMKYAYIMIAKEGLSNIIKHSNATSVNMIVREHPSLYQFILQDNGKTFRSMATTSGLGLVSIKERIDALGGHLQISTETGFRIFITLPKEEKA